MKADQEHEKRKDKKARYSLQHTKLIYELVEESAGRVTYFVTRDAFTLNL